MKNIHIGSIIKKKVMERSLSVKEFADRINCERTAVYHIFKQKSIDIDKLIKISEALNYNFLYEVYLKQNDKITHSIPAIYIAAEIDPDALRQLGLPNDFMLLIKK